ncbi:hypothetical protein C8J57DRAFT_1520151 [Mycena rebaudengoi]|nr:hypothetical protein C8J57DRAFT_1520151 [Mycena rebaudengoi]
MDRLANLILTSKSIIAAAELLPFPYLKVALGPVILILEAVQKMAKNRDFTDLCASIVEVITLLQKDISQFGWSTSIADELNKYNKRVYQLQLNFMTASMAQLSIHGILTFVLPAS